MRSISWYCYANTATNSNPRVLVIIITGETLPPLPAGICFLSFSLNDFSGASTLSKIDMHSNFYIDGDVNAI